MATAANPSETGHGSTDPSRAILADDTETSLHDRIKIVERDLLVQAVLDIANNRINLKELGHA